MQARARIFGWLLTVVFLTAPLALAAEPRLVFQTPGASDDLRDDLVAASLVAQAKRDGSDDPQAYIATAQADYARLLAVLYSNGYYGGVIRITLNGREATQYSALSRLGTVKTVQLSVDPGPLYRFGDARIAPIPRGTTLPEGFRQGSAASTEAIRGAAETSIEAWRANGNAKAQIRDQDIIARHGQARVDARIGVDPGPVLSFGTVSVAGNQNVRTARILKIAGLDEGRRFDPKEIAKAEGRLRRTGSFSAVTVDEAQDIGPGETLPLTIGVTEATPRRFGFGAEISSVEGVRLSGFWLHRNLLGGAERFRVDGEVAGLAGETGGTDLSFGVRYERPATPKADTDFFAELSFDALDEPDFKSDTTEVVLGFTRYASDRTTLTAGVGYLYSETMDSFGQETIQLVTLPLGGVHDRRDNALDPKSGVYLDLGVTPFLSLAGTSDGAQVKLDARAYKGGETLTFAGRLQLGALMGPSLAESPAFYRFYSGGGGTVRGQSYQSLGVDQGGLSTGGRSLLALSGEVRADLNDSLQLVAFADWGYVGSESFPDFTGDSHAGAGLGVRYKTGIGPIRLDVAVPVSGDTEASSFYIYVGIGQAF